MKGRDSRLTEETQQELAALASRYADASKGGIQVINALGGQAESWLSRLPGPVREGLNTGTEAALRQAVRAAHASRGVIDDKPSWINNSFGAVMGAAGGFGGTATALAELPVTTTLLLRVIQGVAAEYGFDPSEESVQFDCVTVFASAGPLADDNGSDTGFLSARLTLSGAALQKILQTVVPRLATALGQKLAAQSVPIIGAAAGAVINYTYTTYYREIALVHFGLRKLAVDANVSEGELIEALKEKLAGPGTPKAG